MSNYTVTTNFGDKDSLPSGNAAKIIKGSEFTTEFNNIATMSATKADSASPTISGTLTTTNLNVTGSAGALVPTAVDLADNNKIQLGTGDDLKIYHDGSNSYIEESGSGALRVLSSNFLVKNPTDDELMLRCAPDEAVDLYYNNSKKLETTDTGAKVTGAMVASAKVGVGVDAPSRPLHVYDSTVDIVARFESADTTAGVEFLDNTSTAQIKIQDGDLTISTDTGDSVADSSISLRVDNVEKVNISDALTTLKQPTRINDNQGFSFGNGVDLTVTHVTSSNTNTVQNNNSRAMVFNGVSFVFQNQGADEKLMEMTANGNVELYQNNNKKFETTSSGVEVTGDVKINTVQILTGSGAPALTAAVGSLYLRTDGVAGAVLYVKESTPAGTGGWVAK
jgi:hypothetical protein